MKNFRIKKFDRQKMFSGIMLVALGLLMPALVTVDTFQIPQNLLLAIEEENSIELLMAAMELVMLNSIRAFPHYLGAFFIGESIELEDTSPFAKMVKAASVMVIIPPVYFIIGMIHNIKYDFGLPALVIIILLVMVGKNDYNYVSGWKKSMLIVVFLTAVQFFDIMPALDGFPIGRGQMSRDVKVVARFLEADSALNITGCVFFLLLMFVGMLLFLLIRDENNLRAMSDLKEKTEKMEMEARIKALENRASMEMRNLVHDLKSPLTSAQALVGVVRLASERDGRNKEVGYLEKVEYSIEKLSGMISEILYENYQSVVTTGEILKSVLAQISISDYSAFVHSDNKVEFKELCVNKIRIVRALINLIENSFYAIEEKHARVDIIVDSEMKNEISCITFTVKDNGKGIKQEDLETIWHTGYSTRSSHGLGLSFVKSVVDSLNGQIEVQSTLGQGTSITLLIPEGDEKDEQSNHNSFH